MPDLDLPPLLTKLVQVTPEIAHEWLEKRNSPQNRPISPTIVAKYAAQMKAGKWMLTHQGPAFDWTDYLIDGQHRLSAVMESGITVPMYVTYNADPDTYVVLDTNYKRQGSHLIPGPNRAVKAAAARYLTKAPALGYKQRVDNLEVVQIVERHGANLDAAAVLARQIHNNSRITPSPMAALLTVALEGGADSETVAHWVEHLRTGAGLQPGDPLLTMRNRFVMDPWLNKAGHQNAAIFLMARTWNAFINGEQLKRLLLPRAGVVVPSDVPALVIK